MKILGKLIELRAIEIEDAEILREMVNDPEMERNVVGWGFPVSKHGQLKWIENVNKDNKNIHFAIEIQDEGCIGVATLVNIDWKNRSAIHGIKLVNKDFRGKGIGTDVVLSIMKYAFEELQLNRLDGSFLPYNKASINLYKKCGWKIEGEKENAIFKNGEYHNLIITGITYNDYLKNKK